MPNHLWTSTFHAVVGLGWRLMFMLIRERGGAGLYLGNLLSDEGEIFFHQSVTSTFFSSDHHPPFI